MAITPLRDWKRKLLGQKQFVIVRILDRKNSSKPPSLHLPFCLLKRTCLVTIVRVLCLKLVCFFIVNVTLKKSLMLKNNHYNLIMFFKQSFWKSFCSTFLNTIFFLILLLFKFNQKIKSIQFEAAFKPMSEVFT